MRKWADDSGDVTHAAGYTPFGVELWEEGSTESAWRHTGEWWDGYLGFAYLRARWYDPATGRFVAPDPFPGYAALPQTQHPYVYVGNNPVNLTDRSGEFAFLPLLAVAAAGGLLGLSSRRGTGRGCRVLPQDLH